METQNFLHIGKNLPNQRSILFLLLMLVACASTQKKLPPSPEGIGPSAGGLGPVEVQGPPEPFGPPAPPVGEVFGPKPVQRATVNLVFTGSGARALCPLGVIRALSDSKVAIASVGGSGLGALVAAMYAADPNVNRLEFSMLRFKNDLLVDGTGFLSSVLPGNSRGRRLKNEITKIFSKRDLSETKIPLRIGFTQQPGGTVLVKDRGETGDLIAQALVPGDVRVAVELVRELKQLNLGPVLWVNADATEGLDTASSALEIKPPLGAKEFEAYEKRNEIVFQCKKAMLEKLPELKSFIANPRGN